MKKICVFLFLTSISLCLNAAEQNKDENLVVDFAQSYLKEIDKKISSKKISLGEMPKIDHSNDESPLLSQKDNDVIQEILRDFLWILYAENFRNKFSVAIPSALGTLASTFSYFVSSVSDYIPEKIMICEEGFERVRFLTNLCVEKGTDSICLHWLRDTYHLRGQDLLDNARYVLNCAPGVNETFQGSIPLVPTMESDWFLLSMVKTSLDILSIAYGATGCLCLTGATAGGAYLLYLNHGLKTLAKKSYAINPQAETILIRKFPQYENLIKLIFGLMVTKSSQINDWWNTKNAAHKNYGHFYPLEKDKNV